MIKYYDTRKFKNIDISNTSMNRVIHGICAFAHFVRIVWIMPKERRDSLNIPGVGTTPYNYPIENLCGLNLEPKNQIKLLLLKFLNETASASLNIFERNFKASGFLNHWTKECNSNFKLQASWFSCLSLRNEYVNPFSKWKMETLTYDVYLELKERSDSSKRTWNQDIYQVLPC